MKSFSEKLKNLFLISGDPAQAEENAVVCWTVYLAFNSILKMSSEFDQVNELDSAQRQLVLASPVAIRLCNICVGPMRKLSLISSYNITVSSGKIIECLCG